MLRSFRRRKGFLSRLFMAQVVAFFYIAPGTNIHKVEQPAISAVKTQPKIIKTGDWKIRWYLFELKSKDPETRYLAAGKLGELRDPRAVGPLLSLLNDPDKELVSIAVTSLGMIGDSQAVEPLAQQLLQTRNEIAQTILAEALAEIGDPRALAPLEEVLVRISARVVTMRAIGPDGKEMIETERNPAFDAIRSAIRRIRQLHRQEPLTWAL